MEYLDKPADFGGESAAWVFRGQLAEMERHGQPRHKRVELATSLERGCEQSGIDPSDADKVEEMMVREFRRVYDGADVQWVLGDTLYCLSLLRHHGAPTRLLDFTYSKNVAVYVGLKEAYTRIEAKEEDARFAVWCVDATDMNDRARKCCSVNESLLRAFDGRANLDTRNDVSFRALYRDSKLNMVISENPTRIHKRLHLQQGVFMCPANIGMSFMDNLRNLYGSEDTHSVKRLVCTVTRSDLQRGFERLMKMNITDESLFPGLDGLASSMNYRIEFLKKQWERVKEAGGWPER